MYLARPTLEMKNRYLQFAQEWKDNNQSIVPYSARLLDDSYEIWLKNTYEYENLHEGFVTAHTFFLIEDENIIGAINIRHYLNDYLFNFGGHIGYGIRPTKRQKGYASKMLALALPVAKQLGIDKVLITCDKKNIASAKTIINNGGILENEVMEDGELVQRYWIDLT